MGVAVLAPMALKTAGPQQQAVLAKAGAMEERAPAMDPANNLNWKAVLLVVLLWLSLDFVPWRVLSPDLVSVLGDMIMFCLCFGRRRVAEAMLVKALVSPTASKSTKLRPVSKRVFMTNDNVLSLRFRVSKRKMIKGVGSHPKNDEQERSESETCTSFSASVEQSLQGNQ